MTRLTQHSHSLFGVLAAFFVAILLCVCPAAAQSPTSRMLRVTVRDSLTHEPIPFAAVVLPGSGGGVLADNDGHATIFARSGEKLMSVSVMGYTPKPVELKPDQNTLTVYLVPSGVKLNEVTVGRTKEKYSKKNNPAVAFAQAIKRSRELTDPRRNPFYNYQKYERFTMGINNFQASDTVGQFGRKLNFLPEYIDTSAISGRPVLNLIARETAADVHFRRDPSTQREVVTGFKRAGIDDILNNQQNVTEMLSDVFREVDLYDNDIAIMQNRFVSPLSRIAPDFYKFYLSDTVVIDGERCVVLSFVPHNSQTFGFIGRVFVPQADTTMFIKRVEMRVPKSINVNFVQNLYINQQFEKAPDGSRLKTVDDMIVELQLVPGTPSIYTRRITSYRGHNFNQPDDLSLFDGLATVTKLPGADHRDQQFWDEARIIPISRNEDRVDELMTRLRGVPAFYWTEKVVNVVGNGYIHVGDPAKIDIGDITEFISGNAIEGVRLQAGATTMAALNNRLFARGYAAWGTKDHLWKYNGELEWSFREKQLHSREFPVHSIRISHTYDVDEIGQTPAYYSNFDVIFSSFTRMENNQMTYRRKSDIQYQLELENNFSVTANASLTRQQATPLMTFIDGCGNSVDHYNQAAFTVELRYAPGEKFYQGKTHRLPLNMDAPVFTLSHTVSPKGLMGSMFTINRTDASFNKRFWLSAFGYIDVALRGAHVWSRAPYPNLLTPNANISYLIQPESFALLNPLEFVMDTYGVWDFTYWINGALLNYVPGFKKLKLREVVGFRGVAGHLSWRNDPRFNPSLFQFPEVSNTQLIGKTPYMEVSVGLDNILKIFRVDYVWRLNYRHNPGIDTSGLRASLHFAF